MTGTAVVPFAAISPSTAALEWAKWTAEEFALGIDAMGRNSWAYRSTLPVQVEDVLSRLYAPGLPDLIDRCDDDLKLRLALWLAINSRHPRHTEVDEHDRHLHYLALARVPPASAGG